MLPAGRGSNFAGMKIVNPATGEQLQSIDEGLQPPPYNEASGTGASMASNVGVFTHGLSVIKGNREYVAELRALWDARRASVLAAVDQAVTVKGAE